MKTIIWKELRENLKWAALALLCLTLAEIYALYEYRNYFFTTSDFTLCNPTFLFVSAVGCSLVGAALGALQILPELRRDQWAALLHRPIPRGSIFFGKVAAGLLLYLLATVVPLLLSIVYVAIPGEFGVPFIPRMALPAVSDLLLGVAAYFAALLVSLSQGPWYGKRAFLALSVLPLIVFHFTMGWFTPPLIAAGIFMAAAYGAMMSHGTGGSGPRLGRVCSILVLFGGVEAVALLLIAGLSLLPGATGETPAGFLFRHIRITDSGRVFISTYNPRTAERTMTDADGKPVTDERYIGNSGPLPFSFLLSLFENRKQHTNPREQYRALHPRSGGAYLEEVVGTNDEEPEAWYLDISGNYFIGYDRLSHRCLGICDRTGFHPPGTAPQPFPGRLNIAWTVNGPRQCWSENQLYEIHFRARTMTPLFDSGADTIYGMEELITPPAHERFYLAVALEKEIRILDLNGALLLAIPYGRDADHLLELNIATTSAGDRLFVEYVEAPPEPAPRKDALRSSYLEEMDFSGKVMRTYNTQTTGMPRNEPGWLQSVTASFTPIAPLAVYRLSSHPLAAIEDPYSDSILAAISMSDPWTKLGLITSLALLAAACAYAWARQAGMERNKALAWTAFVFCFGLPGLITFRLAARWPTRVTCPSCAHQRPIETEECPSCHQAWPHPARTGTEILAYAE